MKRTSAIVAVVAVLGAVFFLVTHDWHPLPPELVVCRDVIPRDYQTAIGFAWKDHEVSLELGQKSASRMPNTEEAAKIIAAVTTCVEKAGHRVTTGGGVYLNAEEPLGELADHWRAFSGGLQIAFKPRDEDEARILNNLAIGPAAGTRAEVMSQWCVKQAMCVKCETEGPSDNPVSTSVELKKSAPVQRGIMMNTWQIPQPGAPSKPWQIVDSHGVRTIYRCGS